MAENLTEDGLKKMRSRLRSAFEKCFGYPIETSDYNTNEHYTQLIFLLKVALGLANEKKVKGLPMDNWFIDLFNKDILRKNVNMVAKVNNALNAYENNPFKIVNEQIVYIVKEIFDSDSNRVRTTNLRFVNKTSSMVNPPSFWDSVILKIKRVASEKKIVAWTIMMFLITFNMGLYYSLSLTDPVLEMRIDQQYMLSEKKDSLSLVGLVDTICKSNLLKLYQRKKVVFNLIYTGEPWLTVKNETTGECLPGKIDGCWRDMVNVYENQRINIQFRCNNDGIDVDSVSLKLRFISSPLKTCIFCIGSILVRGSEVESSVVVIRLHNGNSYFPHLIHNGGGFAHTPYDVKKTVSITGIDAISSAPYFIGKISSGEGVNILSQYQF